MSQANQHVTFPTRFAALSAIPPVATSRTGETVRETRAFRGLTLETAIRYLEHLGGERVGEREVDGPGWHATLSSRKVPVGPSYRLTEVTVTWSGTEAAVAPVVAGFRMKAFRAPG